MTRNAAPGLKASRMKANHLDAGIMRLASFSFMLFACLFVIGCRSTHQKAVALPTPFIDPGNRIVTVEKWASAVRVATAWAVYPDRLVVFTRNDFKRPEIVLAERPLDALAVETVVAEIRKLSPNIIGKAYSKKSVRDGVFFRISFSSTAQLTPNRIEFANMRLPEVARLLQTIDNYVPAGHKIGHDEMSALSQFENQETVVTDVTDFNTQ